MYSFAVKITKARTRHVQLKIQAKPGFLISNIRIVMSDFTILIFQFRSNSKLFSGWPVRSPLAEFPEKAPMLKDFLSQSYYTKYFLKKTRIVKLELRSRIAKSDITILTSTSQS